MEYISNLIKYFVCVKCGYYYDTSLSISVSDELKFFIPKYEMGTDGNWYYFCPICGSQMILKF